MQIVSKQLYSIKQEIVSKYRATTDIYIILCKYLLYCYKDLIDLHDKHQNFII